MTRLQRHYEETSNVPVSPEQLFAYVDDHQRFSSHMNQSSWMMGGGSMHTHLDDKKFQEVGSHIQMDGTIFGIKLFLDEVVTHHEPPYLKTWETVGIPKLLVVGSYRMGIEVKLQSDGSRLRVYIDYDLPIRNIWLGELFGGIYAKWCVQQMIKGASDYFVTASHDKNNTERSDMYGS